MNLVLTGPMGSGKSAVGEDVAEALGMEFVDTDELVVQKAGMGINEIFEKHGQGKFRELEESVVAEVAKLDNHVIATGGGAVLRFVNMRRLRRNGLVVNLKASVETLHERLKGKKDRPLLNKLNPEEELRKHSEGRMPFYRNADFTIETDGLSIEEVAQKVVSLIKLPSVRICACIAGENPEKQIESALEKGAGMVELRLDLIENPQILQLVQMSGLPVIATDRENPENIIRAIEAGCDLVDVDAEDENKERIVKKARLNGCKVIVSMHDFEKTPEEIKIPEGGDLKKIACKVNTLEDAERLLKLAQERKDLIVVGMGELGRHTRVAAPLLGSYLTYAGNIAPGQLPLESMVNIYKEAGLR
ncbi:MAG: type I 3-dehydroquinate dehydratase [archaeon]